MIIHAYLSTGYFKIEPFDIMNNFDHDVLFFFFFQKKKMKMKKDENGHPCFPKTCDSF